MPLHLRDVEQLLEEFVKCLEAPDETMIDWYGFEDELNGLIDMGRRSLNEVRSWMRENGEVI